MDNEQIFQNNVKTLESQLHESYTRISELREVIDLADKLIHSLENTGSQLSIDSTKLKKELKDLIQKKV